MHAAEHRAIRELHATTRELRNHWAKLARTLDCDLLAAGAQQAAQLLRELDDRVELQGRPAAQAVGARLAGMRGVSDRFLERNQAFRTALLDLTHVVTLLRYLAALAETRNDTELATWHRGWADKLADYERRGREEAERMAADPDAAIAPADDSSVGRAGAKLGLAVGTVGEAFDNSALGRLARRRAT